MSGPTPTPPPAPALPPAPAPAPERRRGSFLASLGLLALLFAVAFGGFMAAAAVDVPEHPPVEVVPGVVVRPAAGWQVAEPAAGEGVSVLRMTSGTGNLDVFAGEFQGSPEDLLRAYERDVLGPDAKQLRVSPERQQVRTRAGAEGVRGFYVGVFGEVSQSIEGELTAFVTSSGTGVVFDGWGAQGSLDLAAEDIHEMVDSAELA